MHVSPAATTGQTTGDANADGQSVLPSRFPSLDGWRAVSILLVLGEHSLFTFDCPSKAGKILSTYFDGGLGVRFFFVISGFLITYLLLKEHRQTGKFSLQKFYARRALRILPVYFVYLAVVFALQLLTPYRQPGITWLANLTFTTNYVPTNWTTGHLWSLAVEEQFYLLWPVALSLAGPQNLRRVLSLLGVPIVLAPICRAIAYERFAPASLEPFFQPYSFLNQFDSLAIGCLAAVLFVQYHDKISAGITRFSRTNLLAGVALVIVPQVLVKSWVAVYVPELLTETVANTFQAFGFAMLLVQSVLTPRLFGPLNWPVVAKIGVLSYSIYIWQMLFSNNPARFGLSYPWFMSFRFWWLAVLLVALCSYYFLEKPLMGFRRYFRP
jgi:peptidoglycan/LPS O-acetylase OafA/YrhL